MSLNMRGSGSDNSWDEDDDPQIIAAKADAEEKILQARAKLHPMAQSIYALQEGFNNFVSNLGCLILLLVIVLAIFAPGLIQAAVHFVSGGR